ncbi:MAG: hypothetical protein LUF02_02060 [Erysipelotrichaceae bacterium]|nr:hypothetical protein [Erysipelotrichaceae bacterium]
MIHMVRLSPSSINPVAGKTPYRWESYKQYLMPLNLETLVELHAKQSINNALKLLKEF